MNDLSRQATRLDDIGGRFDPWLLGIACTLACLGVVMVGSASIAQATTPTYYLTRHLVFLAAGSIAEARKHGHLRQEGKAYVVQDGDCLNILFNV